MWNLWKHFLVHLRRTKIFYFCILLAFLGHFSALKLLSVLVTYVDGAEQHIGPRHVFTVIFTVSLFVGGFVAMVYGTWVVPYLHQGPRAALTYGLPVAKWKIPLAYAATFLVLLALQNTIMFTLHGFMYGYAEYESAADFPWLGLGMAQVFQILSLEVTMFGFAVLSIYLGKIAALFLGVILFFVSQLAAFLFATDLGNQLQEESLFLTGMKLLYETLPPWDQVIMRVKEQIASASVLDPALTPWGVWIVLLMAALTVALRFPFLSKGTE